MITQKESSLEPIIISLEDNSEIEITIIELEGNKSKVVRCESEAASVAQQFWSIQV